LSPIDWGLGHASRCVPLIHDLSKNNKVIIGVTVLNRFFFDNYFPELQKEELPSYHISYSKFLPLWMKLGFQWPFIKSTIRKEMRLLTGIIEKHKVDLVISDSRYGLSNKHVHSIFITHQVQLRTPVFSAWADRVNKKYIHHFNELWVPDYEDQSRRLSGELSNAKDIKIPVKYIGPLSALKPNVTGVKQKIDSLILLSGVEPQRSILEEKLIKRFEGTNEKVVVVRGTHKKNQESRTRSSLQIIDMLMGNELTELIVNAETVICRSGYSTLMDLHLLNKTKLLLIPTPGQSEQEYLADHWVMKFGVEKVDQNDL
jgi:uncharacterized protein (TIGR00661 family)